MKKLLSIAAWIAAITGLFFLLGFVESRHKQSECCRFEVFLDYEKSEPLLDAIEIRSWIISQMDSLKGKPMETIDTEGIKDMILTIPCIRSANVYTTLQGDLNVKIKQRKPILRIIDHKNHSYYIDQDGVLFPIREGFSSRARVANGQIADSRVSLEHLPIDVDTLSSSSIYQELLMIARYLQVHPLMKSQIDQVYVNEDREFELIPKLGKHVILFGGIKDMEDKFLRLEAFYRNGLKKAGWNKYDKINLKFKDQIVCSKR
jgi:cell division protein FtsQ